MIRSQLEYACPVTQYTRNHLQLLEDKQEKYLRLLFQLPHHTYYHTLLLALDLDTIKTRFDILTIGFYQKLRTLTGTLAHTILNSLNTQNRLEPNSNLQPPFLQNIHRIKAKYHINHVLNDQLQLTDIKEKQLYIQTIRAESKRILADKINKRNQNPERDEDHPHAPRQVGTSPLVTYTQQQLHKENNHESGYLPLDKICYKSTMSKILLQMDHNKAHWQITKCAHCNQYTKQTYLHQLYECPAFTTNRKNILNSIFIECDYLQTTLPDLTDPTTTSILADGALYGKISRTHWKHISPVLLGVTNLAKSTMPHYKQIQIRKMLRSHLILLHLLPQIQNKNTPPQHQGTLIINNSDSGLIDTDSKDEEKQINLQESWNIDTRETEQGKILITHTQNTQTYIQNIRPALQQMTLEQLEKYNLGFGTANTRTTLQKLKAKKFTEQIFQEYKNNMICVSDGSVKANKGGFGSVILDNQKIIYKAKGRIKTTDSGQAELDGIYHNLLTCYLKSTQNRTILFTADNKYAIQVSKRLVRPNWKHKQIAQAIYALKHQLKQHNNKLAFKWIPGHTDHKWNDLVDQLAKEGTTLSIRFVPNLPPLLPALAPDVPVSAHSVALPVAISSSYHCSWNNQVLDHG